jgi:hypothetical protein
MATVPLALAITALFAVSHCKRKVDAPVIGCCDQRDSGFSVEYSENWKHGDATPKQVCTQLVELKAKWSDGPCGRADIVAGCRADSSSNDFGTTTWYYKGGLYPEVEAVRRKCAPGTTLSPSGKEAQ